MPTPHAEASKGRLGGSSVPGVDDQLPAPGRRLVGQRPAQPTRGSGNETHLLLGGVDCHVHGSIEVEVSFKSSGILDGMKERMLTVGEVAGRSGFAASAVRYYEREGLIHAQRTEGGQRRFARSVLRKLAFIRAARHVGLSLDEVRDALAKLPASRTPTRADWTRISKSWRARLDTEIQALVALRDGLDPCIGCGCLSLQTCRLANPQDVAARNGPGAVYLPRWLREPLLADEGPGERLVP